MIAVPEFFRKLRSRLPRWVRGITAALIITALIWPFSLLVVSLVQAMGFYECEIDNSAWICSPSGRTAGFFVVLGVFALPAILLSRILTWFTAADESLANARVDNSRPKS